MKLVANLDLDRDSVEQLIQDKVQREGYVLDGEIEWDEDGGAGVPVRPMTDEEKEEQGLDPRPPAQQVVDEVRSMLTTFLLRIEEENANKGDFSQDSTPESDEKSAISVSSSEDFGLEDIEDEKKRTSRARIQRIRNEQEEEPELYGDHRKDEDGFVVLKQ